MKYLRKYNESVEDKSFQDIKDICLELEDDGYIVSYILTSVGLWIRIKNKKNIIYGENIQETLLRLKDYLGNNYIRTAFDGVIKD